MPTSLSLKTIHSIYLRNFRLPEKTEDRQRGNKKTTGRNAIEEEDNNPDFIELKGNFHHKLEIDS